MRRIVLPRNTLVVLVGPAGCGKSTFAASRFLPTQIVSSDECRALVSDDPANQGVSRHAFDLMRFLISKRLFLNRLTVADATHLEKPLRTALLKIARHYNFNVAAIIFHTSLETCLDRNLKRDRVVPEDAVRRQHESLGKAIEQIGREGFNYVFTLNEEDQSGVVIDILPGRRAISRPRQDSPPSSESGAG